jgi:hypothetical protein
VSFQKSAATGVATGLDALRFEVGPLSLRLRTSSAGVAPLVVVVP